MDLVLGQPPAVAAAASAADAAASASQAAASAALAAANAASVGFAAGDSVINDGGQLEISIPSLFKSADYTVSAGDRGKVIACTAGAITVTLPTWTSVGNGFLIAIRNNVSGSANITLSAAAGELIDGASSIAVRPGEGFIALCNGGINWRTLGRTITGTSGAAVPLLNAANTWSADQTITSTDAGAGEGPWLEFYRSSASPAANDVLGVVRFTFNDTVGVKTTGPKIRAILEDPTDGTEDASFEFSTRVAGSLVVRAKLGNGLQVGGVSSGPTGGDLGNGTVNAQAGYFINGVRGAPADYLEFRHEVASGAHGGTFTTGAWQTRPINVEVHDTGGHGSLAGNQITLAAGTYECEIEAQALLVNVNQAKLFNITDNADTLLGTCVWSNYGAASFVRGRFTIAAPKSFEVRHRCSTTRLNDGFGYAAGFGSNEVYLVARFHKVA